MNSPVRDAIVEAIRDHGPISFAEYMERALYVPCGYYDRPPVGAEGDFITSPHVHPVFAELLAGGIRQIAERLGDPSPLRLVEVGAGDGTLATQLLAHLDDLDVAYTAVERSGGARARLAETPGATVAEEIPASPHIVLANELLDNLPFRRVRVTAEGPREIRVGLDDADRLVEVLTAPDAEGLERAAGLVEDDEVVLPDGALAFVDRLAAVPTDGMALLIDYGGVGSPRARGAASHVGRARRTGGRADVGRAQPRNAPRRSGRPRSLPLVGPRHPRPGSAQVARPALTLVRPAP